MDISIYPIIIESCEEGGYFAHCPILQGCHVEGETLGEVIDIIHDVIKVHVELRKKNNEPISGVQIRRQSEINLQIALPVVV